MLTNRQLFLAHLAQTSDTPLMLEIKNAKGIYLTAADGKKYLDLISGISVSNIGHCHPRVVQAVQRQSEQYMHLMVYGEYIHYPQVAFARLLVSQLPPQLNCVYFVNSGTEATEGALKLAKRLTGRSEIIYCRHSYHGSTQGALSVMGDEHFKSSFRPLIPGTRMIQFGKENDLQHITKNTAAIIIETIQAEAGVVSASKQYFQTLRKICNYTGTLLILDEIQTAFGRTGTLFAFEQYDFTPDILLLAKAMGGGMPLGAFIASHDMMSAWKSNPALGHITTFGGHPVTCAAGKTALEILLETRIFETVSEKEKLFRQKLQHPAIKAIRSKGLLMALEFENKDINKKIIDQCIQNGIITDWFLFAPHCMRIAPPLIISEEEISFACEKILDAIHYVCEK